MGVAESYRKLEGGFRPKPTFAYEGGRGSKISQIELT